YQTDDQNYKCGSLNKRLVPKGMKAISESTPGRRIELSALGLSNIDGLRKCTPPFHLPRDPRHRRHGQLVALYQRLERHLPPDLLGEPRICRQALLESTDTARIKLAIDIGLNQPFVAPT